MAQMAEPVTVTGDGPGTRHVDRHEPVGTTARHSTERARRPADLLGHGVDGQAQVVCPATQQGRVGLNRVEVEHATVGRHSPGLMEPDRRLDETGILLEKGPKEHLNSLSVLAYSMTRPG